MSTHTPGPWTVEDLAHGQLLIIRGADGTRLATIQLSGDEDGTDLERRANAQLLAAAPPLRAFVDLVARRPCECSSRALRENESECDACAARDLLLDIDRPAREARMAKGGAQ